MTTNITLPDKLPVGPEWPVAKVRVQYGTTTDQIKADYEARKQKMRELSTRLDSIEEKSSCGGVLFLDKVADFLESCSKNLHQLSLSVRNRTSRISAPCAIKFRKK